jgi:hypothetical protein
VTTEKIRVRIDTENEGEERSSVVVHNQGVEYLFFEESKKQHISGCVKWNY